MKRFLIIASSLLACLAAPSLAHASETCQKSIALSSWQESSLQQANTILRRYGLAQGEFTQENLQTGSIHSGNFWLKKPGKMRFSYLVEGKPFSISSDGVFISIEKEGNIPERYPLVAAPLHIILEKDIDLAAQAKICGITRTREGTLIYLNSKDERVIGSLALLISPPKNLLLGWTIKDAAGRETEVRLNHVSFTMTQPDSFFHVEEKQAPNRFAGNGKLG